MSKTVLYRRGGILKVPPVVPEAVYRAHVKEAFAYGLQQAAMLAFFFTTDSTILRLPADEALARLSEQLLAWKNEVIPQDLTHTNP